MFSVNIQPSNRTACVKAGQTILQPAIDQGIPLPYGCKSGSCGACRVKLLSGSVEHGIYSEKALPPDLKQAGWCLPCKAVPTGAVTLLCKQINAKHLPPVQRMPTRVSHLQRLTPDVILLRLKPTGNKPWQYLAGQYAELKISQPGSQGITRAFSMSQSPQSSGELEFHIQKVDQGQFTCMLFGETQLGDLIQVEGPFGSCVMPEKMSGDVVLIATGTGLAPVHALLSELLQQKNRMIHLYWGARTGADLYMHQELLALAASHTNLLYTPVLSQHDDSVVGAQLGYVQHVVLSDFRSLAHAEVFACGSIEMIEQAQSLFHTHRELPIDQFHADAFVASGVDGVLV